MEFGRSTHMKFLFLTSDRFPPFRVDVTVLFGEEIIKKRRHVVDWVMQSAEPCDQSYVAGFHGAKAYVGKTDHGRSRIARFRKNIYNVTNDLLIFSLLKKDKYDFIQVKDKFVTAVTAILAAKLHKTKFVYWLSFPFPEASIYQAKDGSARYPLFYYLRGLFFKFILYRFIMPLSDHIFVQSEQMKLDVAANGIDTNKMTAVPMGVCLDDIPYAQSNTVGNKSEFTIVYLGTLARVRRIDFLVRVISVVKQEIENVTLLLVGDGEDQQDRDVIMDEVKKHGLESNIKITGFIERGKALKYVESADVCVSPFYPTPILNSTSPTKLVEYMAMGKPVVANDHPEQKMLIEETGCGICVPYSEMKFAEAIVKILQDIPHWSKRGLEGREYVEQQRTYEKIADMVERQYQKILGM